MANPDAENTPKPPPNLRVADDEGKECDSCVHYQRGKCALYNNLPVDGEWVCDSYKPGRADPDATPPDFKGKNLREAQSEAYVRVRAHNRRPVGKPDTTSGKPDKQDQLK